jgi:cobyrinic acid a,c-diamide synthase
MAALAKRGLKVAPFKVGPDFIDPGHHRRITGGVSRNLDGWMLSQAYNLACFRDTAFTADLAVVEGVMGLFDGYDGKTESCGSSRPGI